MDTRIDVWDSNTWTPLTVLRKSLRENLFDNYETMSDPERTNAHHELERLDADIADGITLDFPF